MPKISTPGDGFDAFIASLPEQPGPTMLEYLRAAHRDGARTMARSISEDMRSVVVGMGESHKELAQFTARLAGVSEAIAHATEAAMASACVPPGEN